MVQGGLLFQQSLFLSRPECGGRSAAGSALFQSYGALDAIVLGGARASAGMPSFKKILDEGCGGDPRVYHLARTGNGAAGGRVATQVGSSKSHTHAPHVGCKAFRVADTLLGAQAQTRPRCVILSRRYTQALTWANPSLTRLEDQALVPMYGNHPIELGLERADRWLDVIARDATYSVCSRPRSRPSTGHARPRGPGHCRLNRAIVSARSSYDRYHFDRDDSAISGLPSAARSSSTAGRWRSSLAMASASRARWAPRLAPRLSSSTTPATSCYEWS